MAQILVIDDDPTMRLTLSRSLRSQGYDVVTATNGKEGFDAAKELHPSLIICDWMMPLMDGLEVCRHVKNTACLANTYFILLTARDDVDDLVQGLENGADDFLPKPPRLQELKARVRAGLRVHQANEDLQKQKSRLEAELAQASEYVRSILPPTLDSEVSIESCFMPSTQLGGDCFDYYWLDQDHLVIYLLDVSGHGVGAALLSVSVLNLLRSRGLRSHSDVLLTTDFRQPNEVLSALNDNFQMSDHKDMYFTIWYGVYNRVSRQIIYSSGGHPPAVLFTGKSAQTAQVHLLRTSGLPIGMMPDINYDNATCDVDTFGALYVFSDGAYEITKPDGSIWGMDALVETLMIPDRAAHPSLDRVLQSAIKMNKYGDVLEDDLSILEVNFGSSSPA